MAAQRRPGPIDASALLSPQLAVTLRSLVLLNAAGERLLLSGERLGEGVVLAGDEDAFEELSDTLTQAYGGNRGWLGAERPRWFLGGAQGPPGGPDRPRNGALLARSVPGDASWQHVSVPNEDPLVGRVICGGRPGR
jgi:hypothetical protein